MKIERLIGIILYLLNRNNVTASQLANHFEVSKRTILRDIDTLTLAGVPIYSEIGVKGGYTMNKAFALNEKIIDNANLEYLILAIESLKTVYSDKKVLETYEKVKHLYVENETNSNMKIDFSVITEHDFVIKNLTDLNSAIRKNLVITFDYINSTGKTRKVTLQPLHTFYKWYFWYMLGYDMTKEVVRLFKIVRMSNLEISIEEFHNTYDVSLLLKEYEDNKNSDTICVSIQYAKEIDNLVHEYFAGEIVADDGKNIIRTIYIKEYDQMSFSLILGFGNKIEVLSPESYKHKVIVHSENILNMYRVNSDR